MSDGKMKITEVRLALMMREEENDDGNGLLQEQSIYFFHGGRDDELSTGPISLFLLPPPNTHPPFLCIQSQSGPNNPSKQVLREFGTFEENPKCYHQLFLGLFLCRGLSVCCFQPQNLIFSGVILRSCSLGSFPGFVPCDSSLDLFPGSISQVCLGSLPRL